MIKNIKFITLFAGFAVLLAGCKKDYLETVPSNAEPEPVVFSTTDLIDPVLQGAYNTLYLWVAPTGVNHDNFGQKSIDLASDLRGNDIVVNAAGYGWFNGEYQYANWLQPVGAGNRPDMAWVYYYGIIKSVNRIINNVDAAKGAQTTKELLKGQSLALRAYAYFYLINLYQHTYKGNETKPGVPIYRESAIDGNPRGTVADVYALIDEDLAGAKALLTGKPRSSKVNIDISVVEGLRAKVALIKEDWPGAAAAANAAKTGYTLWTGTQYAAVGAFSSISNSEWMWGSLVTNDQSAGHPSYFAHMDARKASYAGLGGQKLITKDLYDKIPAGDIRKTVFRTPGTGTTQIPDYCQQKFQLIDINTWAGDYLYMRVAEMYLIEAEALARQGQDGSARTVLETLIKTRNPAYSAGTFAGQALIDEILLQRRIELWGEGVALTDIKRLKTGLNRLKGIGNHGAPKLDAIVYTLPDGAPTFLLKIPQRELDNNASMTAGDQNP